MFYHSFLLRKIYFCLNYFCATSSWSISKQSNVKSSSWSVWLLYYRLLSSRRYRIWAPSSSKLNTTNNICHALFAFASFPLGKTHMQWPAQFWPGFSVWDWFDLFFKKDAFFWISARKSKMVETHVALGVACRNVCRGPYVHGGVLICQTDLIADHTGIFFCGREAEMDFPESQEWVCSLLDHSKCSLLKSSHKPGAAPQDKAVCPRYNTGWTAGLLLETAAWELGAWIHSHLQRFVVVQRDFSGWEVANVMLFWDYWSLGRKGLSSVFREPDTSALMCKPHPLLLAQMSVVRLYLHC